MESQVSEKISEKNVSDVEFRDALLEAEREGKTLTDVAEKLGLKPLSVYQRYNSWRKAGAKIGKLPLKPRSERKGRKLSNRMAALFADCGSGDSNDSTTDQNGQSEEGVQNTQAE